jgi:peroxiredoxin
MLLLVMGSCILAVGCFTPTEAPDSNTAEIDKRAPGFQLADIKGKTVSLDDFQGKLVFLNFWATWCGPCRSEMPYIQDLYEGQSETGVAILAINVGEDLAEVEGFLKEYSLTFPVLLDISGTVAKKYNIRAIPATYFIDSDGIIRDMQIGAFRNVAEIKDILSQISP